jgi:hypothetical protein
MLSSPLGFDGKAFGLKQNGLSCEGFANANRCGKLANVSHSFHARPVPMPEHFLWG